MSFFNYAPFTTEVSGPAPPRLKHGDMQQHFQDKLSVLYFDTQLKPDLVQGTIILTQEG